MTWSPRISYSANEILLPRKKYSAAFDATAPASSTTQYLCYVSTAEVEDIQRTILLAEFSNNSNGIYGSSSGGGDAWKPHRPTNGIECTGNTAFDGEGYALGTQCFKLNYADAIAAIDAVLADKTAAFTADHIYMVEPNMHQTGSNYAFADGHAGKFSLADTLDPAGYMWGDVVYSCVDKPVIQNHP